MLFFFFLAAPRREIPMFVWLSIFGALTSSYGSYYTYRGRFRIIVARVLTFSYVQPCFASSVGERNIIKVENNFYAHSSFRKFFISKGAEFSKKRRQQFIVILEDWPFWKKQVLFSRKTLSNYWKVVPQFVPLNGLHADICILWLGAVQKSNFVFLFSGSLYRKN